MKVIQFSIQKLLYVTFLLLLFNILNTTAVHAKEKKIIALAPHSVEMLYLIGAGHLIVGTTDFADYPEEAKTIPRVGGYNGIQLETVLEINPDFVIAWEGGNKKEDLERLQSLGFKVYMSTTPVLSDIPVELREMGELTGREVEAEKYAVLFEERLETLKHENKNKKPVSFFYQLWSDPLRTMSAGSWINEMLTTCGGVNIFNDPSLDYPQVSLEHIVKMRPEAIIIPSHHGAVVGSAEQWADWNEIPAVKNNAIYHINGDILHRFSFRVLEGIEVVCKHFDTLRADQAKR